MRRAAVEAVDGPREPDDQGGDQCEDEQALHHAPEEQDLPLPRAGALVEARDVGELTALLVHELRALRLTDPVRRLEAGGRGRRLTTPLPVDVSQELACNRIDAAKRDQLARAAQDLLDPHGERLAVVERFRDLGLVPRRPVRHAVEARDVLVAPHAHRPPSLLHRERDRGGVAHGPVGVLDLPVLVLEIAPLAPELVLERPVRLPAVAGTAVQLDFPRPVRTDEIGKGHDLGCVLRPGTRWTRRWSRQSASP